MRAVNLLPESERPHQSAAQANGATITVGVLGALLIAVLALVVTQNQINGRKGDVAKAEREAQAATTRASALSSYGTFVQTKEARVQSVTGLADARFDWERFMRELALVLPDGTSLLSAAGSTAADGSGATPTPTPAAPAGSAPAATGSATAASPSVTLTGCATSQPRVAVLMVRLRHMYRVSDVQLGDSSETGATAGGSPGGGDSGSCSARRYQFQVSLTFSSSPAKDTEKQRRVSGSLGGGA